MPFGYALFGVLNVSEETLNAVGRPMVAALQTLIHMFVFYAPLALLGAYLLGFVGLLYGVTAANLLGGAAAYVLSQFVCLKAAARS